MRNGAANLNIVTIIAFALGGLLACIIAGSIEYDQSRAVDPNWYFGAYAGLVTILLVAAVFLDRVNEPEIIRLTKEERERLGHEAHDSISKSCNNTWILF